MHLSLDFWRTLCFSNPEYSERRLDFLESTLGVSREILHESLVEIGRFADYRNSSGHMTIEGMYLMLFASIENKTQKKGLMSRLSPAQARSEIDALFLQYPPIINEPLFELIAIDEYGSFNLSSNTGYIKGELIQAFLESSLDKIEFNFFVFSDEIGASKPQVDFFRAVRKRVGSRDVVHVGDDLYADVYGAVSSGIPALHYKNEQLIQYSVDEQTSNFYS